jgi:quinol monooxygenase YgiN
MSIGSVSGCAAERMTGAVWLQLMKGLIMPYLVTTTVSVDPDAIDGLAALFDETNRDLVAAHSDWIGATFSANRSAGEIQVIARWQNPESYEVLRTSDAYAAAMARFAPSFTGPPEITITEVLVEM